MLLADVAAEDGQGTDAQGQGEEGLAHGGVHRLAQDEVSLGVVGQVVEVGHEVELQALAGTLQQNGVDRQHHHQGQQAEHHHLGDLLHAVLQALGADEHAQHHHDDHKDRHQAGLAHEGAELIAHAGGVQAYKIALGHFEEVQQQPPGDGGVVHHEQVVARNAEPAVNMPLGALGLQGVEGQGDALLAGPAHGKLHDHDRKAHNHQKQQIEQHERRAAVLSGNIGEAPYVA